MSRRHPLLCAVAVLGVCLGWPTHAAAIVHGELVEPRAVPEYPAQGYLRVDLDLSGQIEYACGGTMVGTRQFLTAAHCVTNGSGLPLSRLSLKVQLGDVDIANASEPLYGVAERAIPTGFVKASLRNDVAILTLDRPAERDDPTRVVDDVEDDLWKPGTHARIVGWGPIFAGGSPSDDLYKGDVPITDGSPCSGAYATFDPKVMICAAHPAGTPAAEVQDICQDELGGGDGGGPLLVRFGTSFVLAGVASRDAGCGDPAKPGVYTRIGDDSPGSRLGSWVHEKIPEANFAPSHAPRANEAVTLTSTSRHPEGANYFTRFRWDVDGDFDFDQEGKSVKLTFPAEGEQIVGIEASKPEGDKATAYFAFNVSADPNGPPSGQLAPPATTLTPTPPTAIAKPGSRLATIHAAKRPKVKRGRFNISVRFARTAPAGVAIVEVFRGKRKVGIARSRVRRGGTRRISVKLTPTGRRLLARSTTKRLKLRVRVRVGRSVLRTKTLTIRR